MSSARLVHKMIRISWASGPQQEFYHNETLAGGGGLRNGLIAASSCGSTHIVQGLYTSKQISFEKHFKYTST